MDAGKYSFDNFQEALTFTQVETRCTLALVKDLLKTLDLFIAN